MFASNQHVNQDDSGDGARLRIGELSRRTGVRADTLRAWERRYGLLDPERSDGGFRLYSAADERRVLAMQTLIESGVSAAEAARMVRSGTELPIPGHPPPVGELDRSLREALERYDEAGANAILDEAVAALSVEALAGRVILPVLEEFGERWEQGQASVGQEHFATNVVRGRLAGLARNWGAGTGPLAMLACPPGELHDMGLLVFGLVLRARGWRITYFGSSTPIDTVVEAAERLRPRVVVLAALTERPFRDAAREIARLVESTRVLLAGAGANDATAREAGAELLEGDPVSAADRLSTLG